MDNFVLKFTAVLSVLLLFFVFYIIKSNDIRFINLSIKCVNTITDEIIETNISVIGNYKIVLPNVDNYKCNVVKYWADDVF